MTSSREKTIRALVNGCRKGSREDWAELIDRVAPAIFSACYRLRLSREESFDVFGKVSLLLLEHLGDLKEEDRLYGYVSTIAHREALSMKTSRTSFGRAMQEYALSERGEETMPQIHRDMETEHELRIMSEAFSQMPIRCRDLLRLLFLEPKSVSYREISRCLGIPISAIGPTRKRCLEKLRLLMIEKGYEE